MQLAVLQPSIQSPGTQYSTVHATWLGGVCPVFYSHIHWVVPNTVLLLFWHLFGLQSVMTPPLVFVQVPVTRIADRNAPAPGKGQGDLAPSCAACHTHTRIIFLPVKLPSYKRGICTDTENADKSSHPHHII
jgi:hypothetical protein